ncbi:hypothetical protein DFJ63DRAFT_185965 [Scheffersomyces coipomensis]|uniref:uncharacterized protein n=1 Tax=Scheffersomyces coipomensis TaxID=1788519 RepID=UPI00315CCA33
MEMTSYEEEIDFIKLNLEDALIDIHQSGLVPDQLNDQYSIQDIQTDLHQLETYYKKGQLYEMLIMIPKFRMLKAIPPELHFLFGMTFFGLGRIKPALRSITLSIELQFIPEKKRMFLLHLQYIFMKLNMEDRGLKCAGEIMETSKAELFENSTHDFINSRDRFLYDQDCLKKLLNKSDNITQSFEPHFQALHLQAESIINMGGVIVDNSLGKLCMKINQDLLFVYSNLMDWMNERTQIQAMESTSLILFNSILSLCPLYLFKDIIKGEKFLASYLNNQLSYAVINLEHLNYNLEPVTLISRLRKLKGTRETWSMVELMVIHKTILGFIPYYKQDYQQAEKEFEWVHKFLIKLDEYLIIPPDNNILTPKTAQIILIYIGYCKSYSPTVHLKSNLVKYLTTSATSLNESLDNEEENPDQDGFNIQSKVHITYALISEQLAKLESKSIIIEDEYGGEKCALQYDKRRLLSSVYNYIQNLSYVYDDDYMIVPIYDRILWCLLMIGGVHLRTLYFFYMLRNHYLIKSDCHYIYPTNNDDYRLINHENILNNYENAWDIIDKICSVVVTTKVEETNDIWSSIHGNVLLIPQVYELSNRLVLLSESYEIKNDDKQYIESTSGQIAPKTKSCLKKSVSQDFADTIDESKELIKTWVNSFKLQHKSIPDIVSTLI